MLPRIINILAIISILEFLKKPTPLPSIDGQNPPFGPLGEIKSAKFSPNSSKTI